MPARRIAAIRNEAVGRQQLAAHTLKGQAFAANPNGHHLWLPLPARRAGAGGVKACPLPATF